MPRSNGYRATASVRAEVSRLRAELHETDSDNWPRADMLMQNIAALLGHRGGPSGALIRPRLCRYCHRFGHTRQHCAARKAAEDRDADRILREDAEYAREVRARVATTTPRVHAQAAVFDAMRQPYMWHEYCGPIVAVRGDTCAGRYKYDDDGHVTLRDK